MSSRSHRRRSPAPTPAAAQQAPQSTPTGPALAPAPEQDSWLHRAGESLGMGAGKLVTDVLDWVPGWGDPLLDEQGRPVDSVDGLDRQCGVDLEKRHTSVVGPQIEGYAADLDDGWWKDFVSGVGEGATAAPAATYRDEVADKGCE